MNLVNQIGPDLVLRQIGVKNRDAQVPVLIDYIFCIIRPML
jgi:hypothetical protein